MLHTDVVEGCKKDHGQMSVMVLAGGAHNAKGENQFVMGASFPSQRLLYRNGYSYCTGGHNSIQSQMQCRRLKFTGAQPLMCING